MLKFQGSLDDLQDIVMHCAISGEWSFHKKSRFYSLRAETGAILNFWPSTGTINFQGQDAEQFEALFLSHAFMDTSVGAMAPLSEEPVWAPVPGPTPPLDGRHETQGSIETEGRRPLPSRAPKRLDSRAIKLLAGRGQD
jgi:hypothetical protein